MAIIAVYCSVVSEGRAKALPVARGCAFVRLRAAVAVIEAKPGHLHVAAGKLLRAGERCACWRLAKEQRQMGTAADYTIIVLIVAIGVVLWTMFDRIVQLQRDVDALKRKAGIVDAPPPASSPPTAVPPVE